MVDKFLEAPLKEERKIRLVSSDSISSRSRSRSRDRSWSKSPRREASKAESDEEDAVKSTPAERDARTVIVNGLDRSVREWLLKDFFSSVGGVRDVKLIFCNKTNKFKGIAYVEFKDKQSIPLALGLSGQVLRGSKMSILPVLTNSNGVSDLGDQNEAVSSTLKLSYLHPKLSLKMLRDIVEPFGEILAMEILVDKSCPHQMKEGKVIFANAADANTARIHLDGLEVAEKKIKAKLLKDTVESEPDLSPKIDDNKTKQVEDKIIVKETSTLHTVKPSVKVTAIGTPSCFILTNLFNAWKQDHSQDWANLIRDEIINEVARWNKGDSSIVQHIFVDQNSSDGNVYVKCSSSEAANLAVNALHGRRFDGKLELQVLKIIEKYIFFHLFTGKIIKAYYVPEAAYRRIFPNVCTNEDGDHTRKP